MFFLLMQLCINSTYGQIQIFNLDSVRTQNGFTFYINKVIRIDFQETIFGKIILNKPNSLIHKGIAFYKYTNTGSYQNKTYMYDSIYGKECGVFNIKDTLVLFTTKDTQGFKVLKAYWLDDNFNVVKEMNLNYPENNVRDLKIITIDSVGNNYFLFANSYPKNGIEEVNQHSVILKIKNMISHKVSQLF